MCNRGSLAGLLGVDDPETRFTDLYDAHYRGAGRFGS